MEGGCCCGAIRYRIEGSPGRTTHCHCLHCRRTSGAPFVTWFEVEPPNFTLVQGEPVQYASRPGVVRQFCRDCGTQLTFQNLADEGCIDVTACSLDEVDPIRPEDHVWCDRQIEWIKMGDGLPQYNRAKPDR